jgi:hypothetical protein
MKFFSIVVWVDRKQKVTLEWTQVFKWTWALDESISKFWAPILASFWTQQMLMTLYCIIYIFYKNTGTLLLIIQAQLVKFH